MTNKEKYKIFVSTKNDIPLFGQPFWLDVINKNWDVFYTQINNFDFYFPYIIEKKGVFKFIRNPILTPYSSIFSNQKSISNAVLEKVNSELEIFFKQFSIVEIDQHFLLPNYQNNNTIKYHTNIIDTTIEENILYKNLKPTVHRNIKFANNKITIQECTDVEIIFNLIESTAKHRKIKNIYNIDLLQKLIHTCNLNNCGKIFTAVDANGKPIACIFLVWDANCSYSILAASQYPETVRGAMSVLIWHCIKYTKEKNIPIFDFEGSKIKGIDTFFKTFGTIQKDVFQIKITNSKTAKLLLNIKNKLQN